jgi:2-keto-4-pentenoate hydratase/2-oxohepta-3-ene-1,7-dioic acid hydratase in catechol pathway
MITPNDPLPKDTLSLISSGISVLERIRYLSRQKDLFPTEIRFPEKEVEIVAPIQYPLKIIGVAQNYHDYLLQVGLPVPPAPRLFAKLRNTVIGPGTPIMLPPLSRQVSYEAELAVVIGKEGKNIPLSESMSYVFGYTIINDVTAVDIVKQDGNMFRGKNFDTFAPMGPCMVTKDEIPDPHSLRIELSIDGRILQNSNTGKMVRNIPELIRYISQGITLEPGDVIATGTPSGTSSSHDPPVFLTPGSEVKISIEGIGCLSNPVIEDRPNIFKA